ncbi:MAG: UbiH/UbiF/VisC/COQ6 family ubiquinone biosynthesis hydroxylase [Gammaproteobacteria bacterium]|nr:UbiH/UbiF/VisC/COQ6 family ubiquinone biosynthesis hydroxylase [Gammaproteobacteria bacterium]
MKVDVIVIGGGLVGLATARLLSLHNFSVCLLDQQPCLPALLTEQYELRVSAITLPSVHLFKRLGVWQAMQFQRMGEFTETKIWEDDSTEPIQFESTKGFVIENKVILNALLDKAEFNIVAPIKVNQMNKSAENIQVELDSGQKISGKLLIGADGGNSKIREWANLGVSEKAYDQSAIVATVHTQNAHRNVARQKFLPEGPLAFLPLADAHHCSIVWTNTSPSLLTMDEKLFNAQLNKYLGDELGEIRLVGQRLAFPLTKKHAKHYVSERVALVGDAAHTIHPLAGQGVNLGFLDAQALSDILIKAKQENRDIGLLHTLRRYERARKSDNLIIQNLMDVFNSAKIRKLGVNIVSRSECLKQLMLMGMEYREKKLCRKSC